MSRFVKLSIILLLLYLLASIIPCCSDSGIIYYDVYRYSGYRYGGVPRQKAFILWDNGYELLIVFTYYSVDFESNMSLYYFPLPDRPLLFGVVVTSKDMNIHVIGSKTEYTDYPNINVMSIVYPTILLTKSSLAGSELEEVASIRKPSIDLWVVESSHPTVNDVKSFLVKNNMPTELPNGFEEILEHYSSIGWNYMVLGRLDVKPESLLITYYLFKTDHVVYPIYVDKLAPGSTDISITVLTSSIIDRYSIETGVDNRDYRVVSLVNIGNQYLQINCDTSVYEEFYSLFSNATKFMDNTIASVKGRYGREYGFIKLSSSGILYSIDYGKFQTNSINGDFIASVGETPGMVHSYIHKYSLIPGLFMVKSYSLLTILINPFVLVFIITASFYMMCLLEFRESKFESLLIITIAMYLIMFIITLGIIWAITSIRIARYMLLTTTYVILYNIVPIIVSGYTILSILFASKVKTVSTRELLLNTTAVLWVLWILTTIIVPINYYMVLVFYIISLTLLTIVSYTIKRYGIVFNWFPIYVLIPIALSIIVFEPLILYIHPILEAITASLITITPMLITLLYFGEKAGTTTSI